MRIDIVADGERGVDVRLPHGDDLALHPHLHAVKRHFRGDGVFHVEVSAPRQRPDVAEHRGQRIVSACNGAIDPFAGKQQRALDTMRFASGE